MKIFLSYGHDEYEKLAQRLKRDLKSEGFEIWIDKEEIKGSADWEIAIEKGISSSDWLVLMMTEHSVRRPDGVCLDEVSYARLLGKQIVPIMIQEVKPPLCIARIQWIDMQNFFIPGKVYFDEEAYQKKKEELLAILRGVSLLTVEGEQKSLQTKLRPLDNDVYSEHFAKNFYGRKKLYDYYDTWLLSDQRILWLIGDAGIGKTAFIANLTTVRGDVQAVHFCRFNDNERANPKRAIMSIAYYLATQIKEYRQRLLELQDLDNLIDKNSERLFEYLITEPMSLISYKGDTVVVVIDALDEATINGRNELADIIAKQFEKTPVWMKLLVTSRRETLLERKLARIRSIDFSDSRFNDNMTDIRGFFSEQLKDYFSGKKGQYILNKLTDKSEGIFLYAKTIVDEIHSKRLNIKNIDDFPEGLTGVYLDYFDRIFEAKKEISYKKEVRPVMEVLCAACAPLSEHILCDILEMDEYDFADICELICEMFPVKNGAMQPIHKSIIDWMVDGKRSGSYRVSAKHGHAKIADYFLRLLKKKKMDPYAVQYLGIHLLTSNRIEEVVELMSDPSFFEQRVKLLGLDTTLREMLFELQKIYEIDYDNAMNVMQDNVFSEVFAMKRKYFYNSGLYFQLKRCGFDDFLRQYGGYNSNDGMIGISYYYYITESFNKAIKSVETLFSSDCILSDAESSELHNLIGLCYRKKTDFGNAQMHFKLAYEKGKDAAAYYDESGAMANLAKIAYHLLDWDSANEWNRKAISCLQKELSIADDEDYKITLTLFLAEYHRLSAECLIWEGNLNRANEELDEAEKLYAKIQSRDRYYIRYLYTKAFRNILVGDYEEVFDECELLMEKATSSYDKAQILFYRGISAFKLGRIEDCLENAATAYEYAKKIGARLEMEEIIGLISLTDSHNLLSEHLQCYSADVNETIQNWVRYTTSFIKNISRRG